MAATLYDKLWRDHVVDVDEWGQALLYIDRHYLHEVTSPQAFEGLRLANRKPWRTAAAIAVPDHNVPTINRDRIEDPISREQLRVLDENCQNYGILEFDLKDRRQGIVHIVGPEQGLTLPGMTVVCGDSHTATHGALGTLAFGIGTSDVEHVLATQCIVMQKAKNMQVRVDGCLRSGATPKDIILALIGRIGTAGATNCAIEYAGTMIAELSVEGRMTICNMSIEAGARCGLVGVDQKTLDYVEGRPFAPTGEMWQSASAKWRKLRSDPGAKFDRVVEIDASTVKPHVTWGTSPEMVIPVDGAVPDPEDEADTGKKRALKRALDYMALEPGTAIDAIAMDKVFIGSCTNSRIDDLRAAAAVVKGSQVASNIKQALVVPGSGLVKMQAEREGLDQIFTAAGFEWRDAGCSMCLGMNPDHLKPGERCASTSNRNFEGRQGTGGRTHLASPPMVAAAAIHGHFIDLSQAGQ